MILTQANYHSREANEAFWSHSLLKSFLDCEAKAMATLDGSFVPTRSAALAFGSLLDRTLTSPDTLRDFMVSPDSFGPDGSSFFFDSKGRERDNADMRAYRAVVGRVQTDPLYQALAGGGNKQTIFTGEIGGAPWRVMLDFWRDNVIVDLKFMADFDDDWVVMPDGRNSKVAWYDAAGYYRQLACYRHIVQQSTAAPQKCMLVGCTKQAPPDMRCVTFESEADTFRFDAEVARIAELMPHLQQVKSGEVPASACGRNTCAFCRERATFTHRVEAARSGRFVTM